MIDHYAGDRPAGRVGLQARDLGVDQERDVGEVQQGADPDDVGVGLGVHQAWVAVAGRAPDAGAGGPVGLIQQDPAWRMERVVAGLRERVRDLPDPWFMRDRRPRVLHGRRTLGRILAVRAVHLVEPLGLAIPGLEVGVADRPCWRDAVNVPDLAEVLGTETVQRGPVHLRCTADEVVHLRLERRAGAVIPGVGRYVPAVDEYRPGIPVRRLPGQEGAAFQQQDPFPRRGERVGERPAARSGADDDHVEVL